MFLCVTLKQAVPIYSAACSHFSDDGNEAACSKARIQQKLAQHLSAFLSRGHWTHGTFPHAHQWPTWEMTWWQWWWWSLIYFMIISMSWCVYMRVSVLPRRVLMLLIQEKIYSVWFSSVLRSAMLGGLSVAWMDRYGRQNKNKTLRHDACTGGDGGRGGYMPVKCDLAEGIWTWQSFPSWNGNELLKRIRQSSASCLLRRSLWRSNGSAWRGDTRECYRNIASLPRVRCEKNNTFFHLSLSDIRLQPAVD